MVSSCMYLKNVRSRDDIYALAIRALGADRRSHMFALGKMLKTLKQKDKGLGHFVQCFSVQN